MEKTNKPKKILLVDDDEIQLLIVRDYLKDEYELFTAKSGKEALALLIKGFIPNLIILDVLMPNMDGWETYNRLRAVSLLGNVPVVFFTSLQGKDEEIRAYEIGAVDFIRKPYEKEELIKRIETALKNNETKNSGIESGQ
jgi:CheY-like chemotaxis protein